MLWLVGKRRSDTIEQEDEHEDVVLWLVGKRRSDTIILSPYRNYFCCGW